MTVSTPHRPPTTSLAGTRRLYRLHAPFYDATRWLFLRRRAAAVECLALQEGGRALEVGCGTGSNLLRLRARVGATGIVHGLDLSPHMLARARAKLRQRGWDNVHLHEGDAGCFQLGGAFDAVLYSYSLSMIPQWHASLAGAIRHLVPGGRIVIVDFGDLAGCGMLRGPLRRWLRAHHVDTERRYGEELERLLGRQCVTQERGRGGWHVLIRGTTAGA
jgi:S-adenosylmethionine-diacylgycerolhomoserine-N-methlytransferase